MINFERQSVLARLLAKENLTVRHGNYSTAFFDVENRVLGLPLFKDHSKDVYDLLVGHEVGHALYTPAEGWHDSEKEIPGVPRAYINVVEDIRIERKIQLKYPGLVAAFKRGYSEFDQADFFNIANKDVNSLGLMDRINLKAKLRDLIDVEFSDIEQPYVDMAFAVETWEDVLNACRELYNFVKENKTKEENEKYENFTSNIGGESEDDGSSDFGGGTEGDEQDSGDQADMSSMRSESADQESGSGGSNGGEEVENTQQQQSENYGGSDGTQSDYSAPHSGNTDRVYTDEAFRHHEKDLIENGANAPTVIYGPTRKQVEAMTFSIDEIFASRDIKMKEAREWSSERSLQMRFDEADEQFAAFSAETKKFVNMMAKEFEMRKAAYEYSRSQTARSGSLDVNKLYSYKYTDDIFKRVTQLAQAKSHGMVMFVDYSGSMDNVLGDVIKQTLILAEFCKKVNIPFDVYSFTTGRTRLLNDDKTESTLIHINDEYPETGRVDCRNVKMLHLLSSSFNKHTYNRAYRDMFNMASDYYIKGYQSARPYGSDLEQLGGTPLNETALAAEYLVEDFQTKHGVQRVNVVFLTDGDAQSFKANTEDYDADRRLYGPIKVVTKDGTMLDVNGYKSQQHIFNHLRKKYVIIGYHLAAQQYEFRNALYSNMEDRNEETNLNEYRKVFNKNKFISFDDKLGCDRYFVIKASKKSLDTDSDEFEVRENAKKGEITRAFKKHAASKKGNKVFATQFAEMVA